jgi:hypothetical protein
VNQETRWYLIEALMNARSRDAADSFRRRHMLSHFAGVLAGFRYQELMTQAEEETWYRKMAIALGWTLPDPPSVGLAQFVRLEGDDLPSVPEMDLTKPAVLRRLPGSQDSVSDYHGSNFRIMGLDVCDSRTVVEWSVSPEPDVPSLFPEDFAALEAELETVDGWAADELRKKAHDAFIRDKVYVFQLADDIGTQYQRTRHMGHYRPEAATGAMTYKPTVPDTASELVVTWHKASVTIPAI